MIEIKTNEEIAGARIIVAGVGGAGCNAIDRLAEENVKLVELIAINTDAQVLAKSKAPKVIQIGEKLTHGRGAGSKPEQGKKAANESEDAIKEALKDAEMVFVTCGMGGGTGTGAAPEIARFAKEMGKLVVGVVTMPFNYEANKRRENAVAGLECMKEQVDTLITIPNEKIFDVIDRKTPFPEALKKADEVLQQSVRGVTDIINEDAMINCDFEDVRTVMTDKGEAYVGIGYAKGEDKGSDAAKMAIESPFLEVSVAGASDLIVYVTGEISMEDVRTAVDTVKEVAGDNINLIFGANYDVKETDTCYVTVIATGVHNLSSPTRVPSTAGVMFNNTLVRPNVMSGFGMRTPSAPQPSVAPAAPELSVLQNRSTGSIPRVNPTGSTSSAGYATGITSPGDIRSNVKDNKLNIPDFLKK